MGLPQNIKERRKELGLTLAEIAKMVGVTEATVQRWESGNIKNLRQERIASLAVALGTTPAYLMGWENESTNEEKPPLLKNRSRRQEPKSLSSYSDFYRPNTRS